jgi:hypothetical protein
MRIRMTESRKRRYNTLCEATGEATKSKAIDKAVGYYLRMRGDTDAYPIGATHQLLEIAESDGGVTGEQIASIVDCPELRVKYEVQTNWTVGNTE